MAHFLHFALLLALAGWPMAAAAADAALGWPPVTRLQKPWAYWWWMGSAVDTNNLARELARYHDAGLGGVHIIPIYGAKGWEDKYIPYLSPRWMEMLAFTVSEGARLDMGVDMTTGTGWCFGGPQVTDEEANASPVVKQFEVAAGGVLEEKFDPKKLQALMAFNPEGGKFDLLGKLDGAGSVHWQTDGGPWHVIAISQKPSGQKVKRAAPGGEGWMLNPFYAAAMTNYLRWFDEAFKSYTGPKPRGQYQDSYEYRSSWAPDLLAQFERRRGYRLQEELPALFGGQGGERAGRVKCDYRETLSDMMVEESIPAWVQWSHEKGFLTRYQAHGAPGNWLDLYADADIAETEMFHLDRDKLVSKFASSAGHVAGRSLCSSETGTWLKEHFTETLADMKYLEDDLFLSGINHIFFHGACYSPDEAGWPGWHFYASFEMNPRNSIWPDAPALNAYAARCQSILQSGRPDNDVLLYWPIHDYWSQPDGMVLELTVHGDRWLGSQPVGKTAKWLWNRGYQFDFVSDRQLSTTRAAGGLVQVPGGRYRAIVVPRCEHIPVSTLSNLVALADAGAVVIFEGPLPADAPGLKDVEKRRAELRELKARGGARFLSGDLQAGLDAAQIRRETMLDQGGLMCIRRAGDDGGVYFIANRGEQAFEGWLPLATPAQTAVILDPMTGGTGVGALRQSSLGTARVYLQLAPGQSLFVRLLAERTLHGPRWPYWKAAAEPVRLGGTWQVRFVEGGPELPASFSTNQLGSWTGAPDANAQRFAGAAVYALRFDAPPGRSKSWRLDLGKVCQSARVRLNGRDVGCLFTPPFSAVVTRLKRTGNLLEVEVRNGCANRIRDLDRRGVKWKTFHDINFVNLDYRPFDASDWPLAEAGLIGPVTLAPLTPVEFSK
ncbi:MAG: glycosyl hydrolase [Verrucomicrobiota bacterium]|jgi:hypothetical protein